jgi:hypothetical protein
MVIILYFLLSFLCFPLVNADLSKNVAVVLKKFEHPPRQVSLIKGTSHILILGQESNGAYFSNDFGRTWSAISLPRSEAASKLDRIVTHPFDGAYVRGNLRRPCLRNSGI